MNQTSAAKWLICRICLKSENDKLYSIYEPIAEEEIADLGTTLIDKIELCGAVKISQDQNLPNKICNRCVLLLRAAYKFRDLCKQSQSQLEQFISSEPENTESNRTIEPHFDSDAEEQKNEAQEEIDSNLLVESDYVVEESVLEYDDASYESEQRFVEKSVEFITTIDENDIDGRDITNDGHPHYVVEEFDEEDANFKFEEDPTNDTIVFEEHIQNSDREIYTKLTKQRKPAAKRKRKHSQNEAINGIYHCIFCDNAYTDKTKYNNHMKIHVKNKPHECEICKKRFSTTPQLSRHMNSHTGNRPYKCQYCEASFGDPSTKIKHERIHTNERPYKCNLCNKAFGYSNVLKVHLMTHTGEKPHTCDFCGRTFSQLHHKNAHEKRHTKVNKVFVPNSPDIAFMDDGDDDFKGYKIEEI